jgi:2-C-methyl-D-erythritol 2,4-cyclodiphosphate synthase
LEIRAGNGFDVHKFAKDRELFLGGIKIPYERGLAGHSDADVLIHAVMDALLGAAGKGDIGKHFPDTDDAYKGASSVSLLREVNGILKKEGFIIGNIDVTLIAEEPKIGKYTNEMKQVMADAMECLPQQINIKGTTTEKLGFTGRREGIACMASCIIMRQKEKEEPGQANA